jgi:tetratricopeptide (TPR) repeat protein
MVFVGLSGQDKSTKEILFELDNCIKEKTVYENQKKEQIQELTGRLHSDGLTDDEKYELYLQLYHQYEAFKYDSAACYVGKSLQLAQKLNNPGLIFNTTIQAAYCCLSAGLFKETADIVQSVDSTALDSESRISLFAILSKLNYDMAECNAVEPYATDYWQQVAEYNRRTIALLGADSIRAMPFKVTMHRAQRNYSEAIAISQRMLTLNNMNERSYAMCIAGLGNLYLLRGDTLEALPCIAQAAIADIRAALKETTALCRLAEVLYTHNELDRAYAYAKLALEGANFYNARHRKLEVGKVLPIIDASRFNIIQHQNRQLMVFIVLILLLLVLLLGAITVVLKQMKGLKKARRLIQRQNNDLRQVNRKLREVDRIKDEYIGYFFSINSAYIDKIEDFQKLVNRKIIARQYDDLQKLFKGSDIQKERENMFSTFDRIFVKLFPDFVDRFNALFKPEDRTVLKSDEILTTEIRIFALIRLGVTENERIANFLNYSVNTINTYKTKVKNRSIVPNEQFEHKIMEIESVQVTA